MFKDVITSVKYQRLEDEQKLIDQQVKYGNENYKGRWDANARRYSTLII